MNNNVFTTIRNINDLNAFIWYNDIPSYASIKYVDNTYAFVWNDKNGKRVFIPFPNVEVETITTYNTYIP